MTFPRAASTHRGLREIGVRTGVFLTALLPEKLSDGMAFSPGSKGRT